MTPLEALFAPLTPFLRYPWLALGPSAIFALAYRHFRPNAPRPLAVAAGLWLAYAAWEGSMQLWSRSGIQTLRLDLLMLAPALYFFTALAVVSWWRAARHHRA